jgi:hypothetical protein
MNIPSLEIVARRHIDKLEDKLVKILTIKEVRLGEITNDDIARAKDYPIEELFDGKTKAIKCPFHPDKNPSASIKNNRFRCWACGAKHDSISAYMALNNKTFVDTVKELLR